MKTMQGQTETDFPDLFLQPVGIVRNTVAEPFLKADENGITSEEHMNNVRRRVHETRSAVSEIVIREDLAELLDGIEDYSHLTVRYWGHKVPTRSRDLTRVHPMGRKDLPRVGIFSTCSPARPNPVLVSTVSLAARRGNILEVTGLDAIDGSPVVDIKPFFTERQPREGVRVPQWMQRIQDELQDDPENERPDAGGHDA
jgi:tRNA-Thr(GGU) m(6)t(6)A37 methyltransferase TsaA